MTAPYTPQIHPQVIQGGGAPDPLAILLQAFTQGLPLGERGYAEQQANSRSSAELAFRAKELDVRKQELALQQEQERTKQANLAHQQERTAQEGAAQQQVLEALLPIASMNGTLNQILPTPQGGTGGVPQAPLPNMAQPGVAGATPVPQMPRPAPPNIPQTVAKPPMDNAAVDPFTALAGVAQHLDPSIVPALVQHVGPILNQITESRAKGSSVNIGDRVVPFVPGKGYYDPSNPKSDKNGYVSSEQIGLSEKDRLDLAFKARQAASMNDYRDLIRGQVARNQFLSQTRNLRDRGALIQQALLTASSAAFAKDPAERKLLMGSALANFVQASDQKAQLRYQMLQYFQQHVDQSIKGNLQLGAQRLAAGEYPDAVYTAMIAHLNDLLKQSKSEFAKQRGGFLKTQPQFAGWLPEADEFFTNDVNPPDPSQRQPLDQILAPPQP